jgi:uncharacterized OB-fold protein
MAEGVGIVAVAQEAEVDFGQVHIGMRLRAVFKEEREGSILDIKYFKPLAEEQSC